MLPGTQPTRTYSSESSPETAALILLARAHMAGRQCGPMASRGWPKVSRRALHHASDDWATAPFK